MSTRVRSIAATLALAIAIAAPATVSAQASASGHFSGRAVKLPIAGAYSYWDAASSGNGRVIKVVVSNAGFKPERIDAWYDRAAAIHDLFVDEQVKVVTIDFDADGKYRGYSYYFGSGDGCGYCYDSAVSSTVRAGNGRLKGKIAHASNESASFDIDFDVPIPDKVWGDALPRDGGEPGRAYRAYTKALEAGDVKALKAASTARGKVLVDKYEKNGEIKGYVDYRWDEVHYRMQAVNIVGGYVRGDRAVVLFDGNSKMFDALHGEVTLHNEGGAWLVDEELVQIGKR